ncbi:hypothetical protein [Afipia sp. Root123D2]|uniref:hypothetical protein n=1 Tax=Afipia sp. Root123D2 TaxID=1736436 RepID=UPI0032DE34D4
MRFQLGRIDAAQPNPRHHLQSRPQMHPSLKRIAVDDPNDLDRVARIPVSTARPNHAVLSAIRRNMGR